jgi:hypothetical protein
VKIKTLTVLVGLLLAFSCVRAVHAQRARPAKSPAPQTKIESSQAKTGQSQLTKDEKATSTYDRFADQTEVLVSIALSPTRHISLVLFDIGSGKRFVSTTVKMYFRNIGANALGYPRLYLILDEERVEIGFNNDHTGLWANVEIATFDKILSARKVEGGLKASSLKSLLSN